MISKSSLPSTEERYPNDGANPESVDLIELDAVAPMEKIANLTARDHDIAGIISSHDRCYLRNVHSGQSLYRGRKD